MIKVRILGRILEYSNDKKIIIDMFEEINNIIMISGYMLSHLEIDGMEVYENHQKIIEENIKRIMEIKVILVSKEEILGDNLVELVDYTHRLYEKSLDIAKKYYVGKSNDYKDVVDIMEGIMFVHKTVNILSSHIELRNLDRILKIIESFNEIFSSMEKYMHVGDLISMGDSFSVHIRNKSMELLRELKSIEI